MTSTPDELRAAAVALGADPDDAAVLASAENRLSRREAAHALGGDAVPVARIRLNPFATGAVRPMRPSRESRLSRDVAARQLGELTFRERRNARHLAGEWRSSTLARFQTKAGRVWLVKLLETQLTGEETEVPADISEAIEHALQSDGSQTADCPTLASVTYARDTYNAIVQELRRNEKLPARGTP